MRKILIVLMALALLSTQACAFEGGNYPAWDGVSMPKGAAYGSFGGQDLLLEFDPAPDFSMADGSSAQICFFAQDDDQSHYLELYLILPMNVHAGDTISEKTLLTDPCSVTLYEVSQESETTYFSGQFYGMAYPDGSAFELKIDSAETTAGSFSISGSLNAALGELIGDQATGKTISLENIAFDFTLPLDTAPYTNPFEVYPENPPVSAPKFTLPPDYIRL